MKKSSKFYIIFYVFLLIYLGVLSMYMMTNSEVRSVSFMLDKPVLGTSLEGIYNAVAVEKKNKGKVYLPNEKTDLIDSLKGVDINVKNGIIELDELYYNRKFKALYDLIEHKYLYERGAALLENMFVDEQEKIVGTSNDVKFTLIYNKGVYISDSYLCNLSFVPVGKNGLNYDSSINVVFTFFFKEDGSFSYLPFHREDLFILSDYGVSRLK